MKEFNDNTTVKHSIQWEIDIPIFKNVVIARELLIALGIPFGVVFLVLILITGGDILSKESFYAIALFCIFIVLSAIFILFFWGGKYKTGFVLDNKGITNYTQKKQAEKNKAINKLAVILGLFLGKPSVVGAGLLAQSRQTVLIKWNSISKIKLYKRHKTILVKGGFAEKIAVFCNEDNYSDIVELIKSNATNL